MATQQMELSSVTAQMQKRQPSTMELLHIALTNNAAIDVIERLAALQEKALAAGAELDFNDSLNRVQAEIKRVAPDMENTNKKNKWASYAAIDRVIRPIYSREGFSLSFTHGDSPKPDHLRVICRVSLRGHKEFYQMDMPVETQGPQGGAVMTKMDATAAADSRGKRYLIKDIFNIAVAEEGGQMPQDELEERISHFSKCQTVAEVFQHFKDSYIEAEKAKDVKAQIALSEAKDNRKKQIDDERARAKG